jgi:hypothetical protein
MVFGTLLDATPSGIAIESVFPAAVATAVALVGAVP